MENKNKRDKRVTFKEDFEPLERPVKQKSTTLEIRDRGARGRRAAGNASRRQVIVTRAARSTESASARRMQGESGPNKSTYQYLDTPSPNQACSTLEKSCKHKISLKSLEFQEALLDQELVIPDLAQLDTSAMLETKLEAEKVLQLKAQSLEYEANISRLETALLALAEAREGMKKLESDEGERATLGYIDAQIELFKQEKNSNKCLMKENKLKIETLLAQERHLAPESYKKNVLTLKFQEESNQVIQCLKGVIEKLRKASELEGLNLLVKESMDQQIQLFEKEKLKSELKLQAIQESIKKPLGESEASGSAFLVTSQAKLLFFNREEAYPRKSAETELENLSLT